ncbi:MAG: DNA repair protein RecO [Candidatus Kapabacteria bacterium]|nr:DNA repair protein RecO [Candidatus Kapabacteria bacterium]
MIVKTEAVVLKTAKQGDTSKIASLYTDSHGLISVIAKGARNSKSKFGSALEPLSIDEITFYHKPSTELYLLSNADSTGKIRKLQSNTEYLIHGLMIAETIMISQVKHSPNAELSFILKESLMELNRASCDPFAIFASFLLKFSNEMGFAPEIELLHDISPLEHITVSLQNGCSCTNRSDKTIQISADAYSLISKFNELPYDALEGLKLNFNQRLEVFSFLVRYISYHFDKRFVLKSAGLLNYG